jgi:hypothetical protein
MQMLTRSQGAELRSRWRFSLFPLGPRLVRLKSCKACVDAEVLLSPAELQLVVRTGTGVVLWQSVHTEANVSTSTFQGKW